jgi:D-glycero-alpha-D-manno-heptose-7-phosphate kinase
MRNKHALASDAIRVEQEVIREAVGSQDQISAAYGGFNRINFNVDGSFEVKPVMVSPVRMAALQQHCALYFTGFSRTASEIAQEQIRTTPQRKHELELMFQMVDEAESIVTNPNRSLDEFGHLLHECWQVKRTLTQKITNAHLDEIYEAGRSAGALGGKLLGAGGGGFMLFFVPPERREALRARLKTLLCVPMKFSNRGSHVVVHEPEEVYDESLTTERSEVYAQQPRRGVN